MFSYDSLRGNHGIKVSQSIDSPILLFDTFSLSEMFAGLFIILLFGVIFYTWGLMFVFLILVFGVGPIVRSRYPPGIYFHWPYRHFHMVLPGIINPKGRKKFSD